MNARGHATLGAIAGAATAIPAPFIHTPTQHLAYIAATIGAALLPDLDMHHTAASNTYGKPSRFIVALTLVPLFGGHRKASHRPIAAPAGFAAVACLALLPWAPVRAVVIALTLGIALAGLNRVGIRNTPFTRFTASIIAGWVAWHSPVTIGWWLPAAVWVGVVSHLIGDHPAWKLITPRKANHR